jgi:Rod binding domain-containing protein
MLSVTAAAAATAGGADVASSTPTPRLVNAAHEFEAQMMKELLKPMMSANNPEGEEDETASGSGGALGDFATEALARGLSEQGGFGIASSIVKQLTPSGNKQVTTPVT